MGSHCGHVWFLSASQTLSLALTISTLYNVRQEQYTPLLTGAHTMARTGNPRGRPKGSGLRLGAQQTRVTIRIPQALYDRLDAYAAGRHFTRGTTQLADCVRELLEHALACPYKRQIKNIPMALEQLPEPHRDPLSLPDYILEEPLPPMGDTP